MVTRALVLAGGGVAGMAWELGVLLGIRDVHPELFPDLLRPDLMVGTSAGAAVAAQLGSGLDLEDLWKRQLEPPTGEIAVEFDLVKLMGMWGQVLEGAPEPLEARRRIGQLALDASDVPESARIDVMRSRLPSHEWPDLDLRLTAVDCANGELVIFTRDSGVSLIDAVAASCAVPMIWPPVTIGDQRYMDGGVASTGNPEVAAGCEQIIVLTPQPLSAPSMLGEGLAAQIARIGPEKFHVVDADETSVAAFGTNPLDPASRKPSANAGRILGRLRGDALAEFLV